MLVALAMMPSGIAWRQINPQTRLLLIMAGLLYACLTVEAPSNPHYAAPMTGVIYALLLIALRQIRQNGGRAGVAVARTVPLLCGVLLLLRIAGPVLHIPASDTVPMTWCSPNLQLLDRARVLAQLERLPGLHLAIVQYKPIHDVLNHEWVYNGADVDNSKVVWAQDMGATKNTELIRYFQGRQVWLVEPDEKPAKLSSYPAASASEDTN